MPRGLIDPNLLTDIADAIREMLGTDGGYTPAQMPAAIRSITASFDLPDYWQSYLDNKLSTIRAKIANKTATTAVFGYFSDSHITYKNAANQQVEGNAGHTGEIMRYLAAKAGIRRWVFGGDALSYENTQALVTADFDEVSNWLMPIGGRVVVKGNHDLNPYGSPNLTDAEYHEQFFDALMPGADALYYYIDEADTKTRYIVLDTRETSINESYTNGDATEKAYVNAEITWLISTLNSTPSGWQIIVLPHVIWWGGGNMSQGNLNLSDAGADVVQLCGDYNSRSSGTKWGQSYNFSSGAATVAICLSGHTHIDYSRTYNNVAAASITADSYAYANARPDSRPHTVGTPTEQSLDIWFVDATNGTAESIRIGCGDDRAFAVGTANNGQLCKITNNLTNCTTNNAATTAKGSYTAVITATSGDFVNGTYSVKVNGYDFSSLGVLSNSNQTLMVTINPLVGDVEILANASTVPVYTVTNNLTRATTTNNAQTATQGESYTATITPGQDLSLIDLRVTMGGVDITSSVVTKTSVTVPDTYNITNNLTHVTTTNNATKITQGQTYQATITAASGYSLYYVKVFMGGVDVTATVYTSGTINIPSVTGAIVITAVADPVTSYTNLIRQAEAVDSSAIYNDGLGYKNGYYLNSGDGHESSNASDCMTGCIPYVIGSSQPTDIIYIKGYTGTASASHTRLALRRSDKTCATVRTSFLSSNTVFDVEVLNAQSGYYKLTPKADVHHVYTTDWLQFSFAQPDGSTLVITKNEPIE